MADLLSAKGRLFPPEHLNTGPGVASVHRVALYKDSTHY